MSTQFYQNIALAILLSLFVTKGQASTVHDPATSEYNGKQCPNVSTAPLRQWGFRQCLLFSWETLRGKH